MSSDAATIATFDQKSRIKKDFGNSDENIISQLENIIDESFVCMMTTKKPGGELVSRPMAIRKRDKLSHFYFVTDANSAKVNEIANDAQVNLAFCRPLSLGRTTLGDSASSQSSNEASNDRATINIQGGEWYSISGTCYQIDDPVIKKQLWGPDLFSWFDWESRGVPDEEEVRHSWDDPRIMVFAVSANSISFNSFQSYQPIALWPAGKVRHLNAS